MIKIKAVTKILERKGFDFDNASPSTLLAIADTVAACNEVRAKKKEMKLLNKKI